MSLTRTVSQGSSTCAAHPSGRDLEILEKQQMRIPTLPLLLSQAFLLKTQTLK